TAAMIGRSVVGSSWTRAGTGADVPGTGPLTVVVIPQPLGFRSRAARPLPMENGRHRRRRHLVTPLKRPDPQSVILLLFSAACAGTRSPATNAACVAGQRIPLPSWRQFCPLDESCASAGPPASGPGHVGSRDGAPVQRLGSRRDWVEHVACTTPGVEGVIPT